MSVPLRPTYVLSGAAAVALLAGCSQSAGIPGSQQLISQSETQRIGAAADHRNAIPPRSCNRIRRDVQPVKAFFSPAIKVAGAKRFISDFVRNTVYIYAHRNRIAALKGFTNPSGLATDGSGNLYVANEGAANILVYAPPYTGAPTTLNDSGQFPADVAVDSHGNVAACSLGSPSFGAGGVSFTRPAQPIR